MTTVNKKEKKMIYTYNTSKLILYTEVESVLVFLMDEALLNYPLKTNLSPRKI